MGGAVARERTCPECGATVPVEAGYPVWCEGCGWNLQPEIPVRAGTPFAALYARLGERRSRGLYRNLVGAAALRPRLTPNTTLALLLATAVHGLTLALVVAGIALPIATWPHALAVIAGVLCLLAAWTLRPRPGHAPAGIVARDACPTLYRLADGVAGALGARRFAQLFRLLCVVRWLQQARIGRVTRGATDRIDAGRPRRARHAVPVLRAGARPGSQASGVR